MTTTHRYTLSERIIVGILALGCIFGLVSIIAGCADDAKADQPKVGYWTEKARSIEYFYDERTSLCFAFLGWGNSQTMTNVPCKDKVVALSKN